ncbi:alpha-ketoglutarate-dependent dioxygenase [bacteria symbiont BFo1 of Frankliniella occidentalis]|jgi:alkylated DNA repair protein (DNA oxidative demethylase)|uniref:DNA oxidative demethylase AlkB n=1 Tax=Erwinia aphidicola TaxID=68334 RepID=UPI0006645044|nr:DNA oxidative demethylase AlkB [Erwinia aphidicola]KMV71492.1 alpha-ketoglutarate-dependent dioxygenase [bacteria symbiont BFo1 of Frankliniella occidentalis]PIJ57968.1 alpha-ketoglutarate-dependent dioxygenase AlkB [Erwinia sp. OLMDLW33]KYP85431.1 alpha-ketoglutarate-dependent dioxygenase [bacteria symbiont BFo1 of Frankliniella occidentalis]KYP90772.1 alpha-ketoglutarate-dependent dioxygenase [bacteria symbiont BFo1 of Frankliniella occidentalis]MBD1375646.1 DNA oxidative demethylase AlkB
MLDLFAEDSPWQEPLAEGAVILRRRARARSEELMTLVEQVAAENPFRHRITPGGHRMSVAMTNCGDSGWTTDSRGYQYSEQDNLSGQRWPAMPPLFRQLAVTCAREAGFNGFNPDACLLNRYQPGAKLTLHQDKDERDLRQPIVSVSLGLPAIFLFGGFERGDGCQRVLLEHGDVVVWGGPSRLRYHGILPLKPGIHPLAGAFRFNLTFRRAR